MALTHFTGEDAPLAIYALALWAPGGAAPPRPSDDHNVGQPAA